MYISRVQIKNFRNFQHVDVRLKPDFIVVGENRSGKTNFLSAIQLLLDPAISERSRGLSLTDIWDGYDWEQNPDAGTIDEPFVEVHIDFSDFERNDKTIALLTDFRLADSPSVARLSYALVKAEGVSGVPSSGADLDYVIFGAGDPTRVVVRRTRQRICLDLLPAMRDAEKELSSWRHSPLRALIEDAINKIPNTSIESIGEGVSNTMGQITGLEPISELEQSIRSKILNISGTRHDLRAKFGIAASDPIRLFHSIRVFIDDGHRGIEDASVGSASVALLALKMAEFEWRREKNERNFTLLAIEEPEAHIHPHLQRRIFKKLFSDERVEDIHVALTTHSPNVASVAPIDSIVMVKRIGNSSEVYSTCASSMTTAEKMDLQRYINTTRADMLFSRGIIFVEGDAEDVLLPVFSSKEGLNVDDSGISICNVSGTNFVPYVKFADSLRIPFIVITDWDPRDGGDKAYGWNRVKKIIGTIRAVRGEDELHDEQLERLDSDEAFLRTVGEQYGVFVNTSTLELELLVEEDTCSALISCLLTQELTKPKREDVERWQADHSSIDGERLMSIIGGVSKGRFASILAEKLAGTDITIPNYIRNSIEFLKGKVQS